MNIYVYAYVLNYDAYEWCMMAMANVWSHEYVKFWFKYEWLHMSWIICKYRIVCFMKDMIYGQECKYVWTKNECALHMTNKGCQLFILNTEIMDMDMDMGCVLSFGAMPSKFYRPSGHFYCLA